MALCEIHEAGNPVQLVSALHVLPVVDMVSAIILLQIPEPVQHNHVGQPGQKAPFLNIRPTLGVLLLGSIYIIVLHIVLALALALALGAMLLLILVMVLGIALLGDILAAFVLASVCTCVLFATCP